MELLIGDNPFHNISHLSQERARRRNKPFNDSRYAAKLIIASLSNGANGFMFSISDTTLSILESVLKTKENPHLNLFPIAPYAYEYVRRSAQVGMTGLAKEFFRKLIESTNIRALGMGIKGFLLADLSSLMKTYLSYEFARLQSIVENRLPIRTFFLHQLITDMALALKLDWLFEAYIASMQRIGVTPGFNTGNFAYLINSFNEWNLELRKIEIAAPFNKIGFQMIPTKKACENALSNLTTPNVFAVSILAAGYLKPLEAVDYIKELPNLKGVAVGVSKEKHAFETFKLLEAELS